ncbi:MAG: hypothetical protein ACRCY4_10650 [Brevinema sp.]
MKKVLSLSALFVMLAVGACSVSPGQDIANALEGTWVQTGSGDELVFSGSKLTMGDTTANLANPDNVKLGNHTYAVYVAKDVDPGDGSKADMYQAFRADGNNLLSGGSGTSMDVLKKMYEDTIKATDPDGGLVANKK